MVDWRKTFEDIPVKLTKKGDVPPNNTGPSKPLFDEKGRVGNQDLVAAGYVECEDYKPATEEEPILGYFCATCEYSKAPQHQGFDGWCDKVKGDICSYGCCNLWERKENGESQETE